MNPIDASHKVIIFTNIGFFIKDPPYLLLFELLYGEDVSPSLVQSMSFRAPHVLCKSKLGWVLLEKVQRSKQVHWAWVCNSLVTHIGMLDVAKNFFYCFCISKEGIVEVLTSPLFCHLVDLVYAPRASERHSQVKKFLFREMDDHGGSWFLEGVEGGKGSKEGCTMS